MHGWMGTILRVDLTEGTITKEPLDQSMAEKFIGGRGLNSWTLFKEIKPGIDPLGPENVLCFSAGPLTGTALGLCSRLQVSTLSPYSGILGDGNGGGSFPTCLKRAGYDQIIITGKADKPQYLWIEDDKVELRDAGELIGMSTWETTDALQKVHGERVAVASIGQAGENLVRYATVIFDKYNSAARGSGAVMGSKNLKAIAVRGTQKVEVAKPEEFGRLAREDRDFFLHDSFQRDVVAKYGTHMGMLWWGPGYRYFSKYLSADEVPEQLKPEALKKYEVKRTGCHGCVAVCKDVYRIPEGDYAGEIGSAMEFECISCLGTNCGIADPVAILTMENLADKYGMCVIALGNAVAFVKDLYNRGIITTEDTGGLTLEWEDAASQIELIHRIALRQGFGNIVAEGIFNIAKIIGRGAMDYCYHVKGLSRGPYPAGLFSLAHATSTRGADHLRGRSWAFGENDPEVFPAMVKQGLIPQDPVETLALSENAMTLTDAIGRCKGAVNSWVCATPLVFKYPLFDGLAMLMSTATGVEYSAESLNEAAERIYLLEMAFNAKQGITKKHDRLPQKPEVVGTPEGEQELRKHQEMLEQYYALRGCDPATGIPAEDRLKELGLEDVAAELGACGPYAEWDGPVLWPLDKYPHGTKRA